MNWYKKSNNQDDFFSNLKNRKIIKRDLPSVRTKMINLYRGFNIDFNKIKKENGYYILSPKKCEQGFLWFAHDLQYDVKKYYVGRGEYVLTYPLEIKEHYETVYWDDNSTSESVPKNINDLSQPTENCKYWGKYELPNGFLFSYKTEKHIVCEIDLKINDSMISKNIVEEED